MAWGLFLLGSAGVWLALDVPHKLLLKIDYHAGRKDYEQVLAVAAKLKAMSPPSELRLHLALYHTGRLGQDLFSYPNQTGWKLLPELKHGLDACRAQSETLFELGQVNLAEHFAHEALEYEGDRPEILRRLAQIYILKDRPKAARVFLNVLRQAPLHREWAAKCLRDLEAHSRLPGDTELARIRTVMVTTDEPHDALPPEPVLLQLLQTNRRNQMAFEYLMAHFLLTREPDKLVKELGRLGDFNYKCIPRHYEEAVLLQQQLKAGSEADLQGRQIRPETVRRFQQFSLALQRRAHENPAGRQALARDFGDTFWHYFFFGGQGVTGRPAVRYTESS